MAKKKPFVKLRCDPCKRINYHTKKSKMLKAKVGAKLELKKFCKWCRKHTLHKEKKK
jgi:large subunit ribosomal protein L33